MANETRNPISPYCSRMRSKKLFFAEGPPRERADILDGSGWCWCAETQDAVGPDRERVDPDDCQAHRRCHVPFGLPSVQA